MRCSRVRFELDLDSLLGLDFMWELGGWLSRPERVYGLRLAQMD